MTVSTSSAKIDDECQKVIPAGCQVDDDNDDDSAFLHASKEGTGTTNTTSTSEVEMRIQAKESSQIDETSGVDKMTTTEKVADGALLRFGNSFIPLSQIDVRGWHPKQTDPCNRRRLMREKISPTYKVFCRKRIFFCYEVTAAVATLPKKYRL